MNEARRIQDALLGWLNDHGDQGIIITDEQLRICGWNRWLEVHTGCKSRTIVGQHLLTVFPKLVERKLNEYYERALQGQSGVLSQKFHKFLLEMPSTKLDDREPMCQSVRISPLLEDWKVIGTVTVIADVTERVKREAELQKQLEERAILLASESTARGAAEAASTRLRNLQFITDTALEQMSLDNLLNRIVKGVKTLLNTATATILLADDKGDLIVRASEGITDDLLGMRVPAGSGFAGLVAREGKALTIENNFPESPLTTVLSERGMRALSGVPLIVETRLLGVLYIGMTESGSISDDDLRFLNLAGDRVALAIDRARLYEGEREARAQAEQANQLKDQFLATVSHELRTPLNAILGWARMLTTRKIDAETAKHAIEVIERNARSQAQLIDDLLDVSRIISGKIRLSFSPVELVPVIEAALDAVRPAAEAKGIKLETRLDSHIGPIPGDADRIQQVVWNLLSNAIKFTGNEGFVSIEVNRLLPNIEIKIIDTGQGISKEFLPFVFDRFRQADATVTRTHSGLGLGLAIVRHLVELHGGTVKAESPGEGRGATFTVRLPMMRVIGSLQEVDEVPRKQIVNEVVFRQSAPLNKLRLLIVDDEPDSLDLLSTVLRDCGAEVFTAASAAEGLKALTANLPDVLISDIEMPVEDGYTFIRKVRELSSPAASETPAIALTAHANAEDRMRALSAGFNIHVPKPVEPVELILAIGSLAPRGIRKEPGTAPL
ncbi:MAG TPA: ATP-binding protein [Pyrinomonadaceae bacterium]|nr:ATP-binding protein [Pyrinomonadaceae bacterium]